MATDQNRNRKKKGFFPVIFVSQLSARFYDTHNEICKSTIAGCPRLLPAADTEKLDKEKRRTFFSFIQLLFPQKRLSTLKESCLRLMNGVGCAF